MRKPRSPPCAPCHGGCHKPDEDEDEEDTGAGRAASAAFFSAVGDDEVGDMAQRCSD